MHTLGIDIETYSSVSLKKSGLHRYIDSEDFDILLFAYSFDDGPVEVIDLYSTRMLPPEVASALFDSNVLKTAWNAQFEVNCLNKAFGVDLPLDQWECTMIKASMLGYPASLDGASKALKLEQQKMSTAGKRLIKFFSEPCKPTRTNGYRTRNLPEHNPRNWEDYKTYNKFDVLAEQEIRRRLSFFRIPPREQQIWRLDQKINNSGVMLDKLLVDQAIALNEITHNRLISEAAELTGVNNPNSVAQLKEWLEQESATEITSLTKDNIKELLKEHDDPKITKVLQIRQEIAKTSIKKYVAMDYCCGSDHRARGLFQFYGASKTGRWSGRLIQVQNLPRNSMKDLDLARQLVREGMFEELFIIFGNVPDVMSQLIRTSFIAPPGKVLAVSDFSAIEARVVAWFAGEKWRLDVFADHGKIYEASGAQMFKMPIEQVVGDIRSRSKVAELALGFQGGVEAMKRMGALQMGIPEDELPEIVSLWRNTNRKIVQFWYAVEKAAIAAVQEPGLTVRIPYLSFFMAHSTLFIQLPSGRILSYVRPYLKENKFGKTAIIYEGVDQKTRQWCRQDTYGGKLVENIVQGTSRDILADAMLRLDGAGYEIVMHVHDEVALEVNEETAESDLDRVNQIMATPIGWAPGLPLNAKSFVTRYYIKD